MDNSAPRGSLGAGSIFRHFRTQPGSDQIATRYAIRGLQRWLRRRRPWTILEIGGGIGTLTWTCRTTCPEAVLWIVEDDAGCRRRLLALLAGVNWLSHDQPLHRAVSDYWRILSSAEFNGECVRPLFPFVIVDAEPPDYMGRVGKRATVFFEGNRTMERHHLELALGSHRRMAWACCRPWDRSKGYWVYQFEPTRWERLHLGALRAWHGALDRVARLVGVRPGWRRRDTDPSA